MRTVCVCALFVCAQCSCAHTVRVRALFLCMHCLCARTVLVHALFVCAHSSGACTVHVCAMFVCAHCSCVFTFQQKEKKFFFEVVQRAMGVVRIMDTVRLRTFIIL